MSPRRSAVAASAVVLIGALGACSGGGGEQPGPAAGPMFSVTSSTVPGTTTSSSRPAVGTPPTTLAVPGGCPAGVGVAAQSAQQAARCLFQAWEADDRTRAAAFASLDVVDTLFRERWSAPSGTFDRCSAQPGTDGQLCTIEHRGTPYQFDVRRSEGGWRVTQLRR